jgi:hypothetical protein
MARQFLTAPFKLGELFRGGIVVKFIADMHKNFPLFLNRKFLELRQDLGRAHVLNLPCPGQRASRVSSPS